MSNGSGEGDNPVLTDFLETYLADRERGVVRSLDDYLLQFPGHAEAIANEFLSLRQRSIATGDAAGDRIGHYHVLDEIGRGGQGIVYLAEDTRLHRKVALKVLKGIGSLSEDAVARFRREAEAASRLDHPGICAVYEAALDGKVPYIAMRLVEGESLAAKIASAKSQGEPSAATSFVHLAEVEVPLSPHPGTDPSPTPSGPTTRAEIMRIVHLLEKAARALHAAHEAGVLHRDMKPGNVMVTPEGEAVIMDFGLAYLEDEQLPTLTQTGEFFGTPAYMSPEQLLAQRVRVDRRTDVWSLGVMLYECVTLTRPFDAPTREGVYQAIQTRQPLDPRRINRSVPDEIRVVIETALEKDRDRRYQTALDFAEELRRVRCFEPIRARPAGPILRFRRWAQRNPVLATAIGSLFLALSVGLAIALVLLAKSERERVAKEGALAEVTKERNEKEAALEKIIGWARIGELTLLQTLVAEAGKLWPIAPAQVPAMKAWIDQSADLARRLPEHEMFLASLRASALPYTEADREADLLSHSYYPAELARFRKTREEAATSLATAETRAASRPADSRADEAAPEEIRATIAKLDASIAQLNERVHKRATWKFATPTEQFKHDTEVRLVSELTKFVLPDPVKGTLADVRARLAYAETVERDMRTAEQETLGKYETRWADAIGAIADKTECPKYGGLRITPQAGLIPIGKDPASGLFEFAHFQTTAPGTDPIPIRGADGRLVITESTGLVFVLLPGGTFRMGSMRPDEGHPEGTPNVYRNAAHDESPIKDVTLDPCFLSKYEMTQGQWLRTTGRNPSSLGRSEDGAKPARLCQPVETVSWVDCDRWLARVGLVLPTEAQWEYAARAGTTTPRWTGIGTDGLDKAANVADLFCKERGPRENLTYEPWNDGHAIPAPVGSFTANAFGLHDVLGNVSEWCRDAYLEYSVPAAQGDGLRASTDGSTPRARAFRGASWSDDASRARSSKRYGPPPEYRTNDLGIRPAKSCRLD